MIENYNVFKGIKQVFESTYTALTNSQKEGYLWFVRKDSATTVGDVYFGTKKYAEATDISIKADKSEAISALSLTMDSEYKLTLSGRTADGSGFTVSDVIDLPLETMVVSGAYDSANTQIVLTLKNGSTTSFPVSALVDGLQSEITTGNTLSADLISDGTTNKVVTGTDKTNWNNAYASAHTHTNKSVLDGIVANDITNWNNAYASAHTHSNIDILNAIDSSAVNTLYSAIQGVTLNGESFTPDTANTVNLTADTFDGTIEIYGSDESPLNNVETPGVYKVVYLPSAGGGEVINRGANPNAIKASVLFVFDNNGRAQQAEYLGESIRYRWEYSGGIKSINWTNWEYLYIADVTGNMSNWNEAYGNSHVHDNWSIINNITSADTENWDNAYASAHTHSNKAVLDDISSSDVSSWNDAASSAHSHTNKDVLDSITSAKTEVWDAAIQGITFNGVSLTPDTANTVDISGVTFDGEIVINGNDESPLDDVETPGVYKVVYKEASGAKSAGDILKTTVLFVRENSFSDGHSTYTSLSQAEDFGNNVRFREQDLGPIKTIQWGTWNYVDFTQLTSANTTSWWDAVNNSHWHDNKTALDAITTGKTQNWDNAYASAHTHSNQAVLDNLTQGVIDSAHTHSNKSTLDGISSTDVTNWNNASSSAHTHTNKTALDNLTQTVIDNSHTHSNQTALDAITTGKTANWDEAYASAHTHDNKTVLDDISSSDVDKWDAAIQGIRVNGVDITPDTGNVIDIKVAEDYSKQYLTLEAVESGTFTLTIGSGVSTSLLTSVSYSVDNGNTWTTTNNIDSQTVTITTPTISVGGKVLWKGDGTSMSVATMSTASANRLASSSVFSGTGRFNVAGNAMSLLYGDNFSDKTVFAEGSSSNFALLFYNSAKLESVVNLILPATEVKTYGYIRMFQGCPLLKDVPKLLATKLNVYSYAAMFAQCASLISITLDISEMVASGCCNIMFGGCASLVSASVNFHAMTLADSCYNSMFQNCTSLTKAPDLPATDLTIHCYEYMFYGCTSLTEGPKISALTLATQCFKEMFRGCTALKTAPELLVTFISENDDPYYGGNPSSCCYHMFYGCTSLNYIKCLGTNVDCSNHTVGWVNNVSATGTFVKADSMETEWTRGVNGIPTGWTVYTESEYELAHNYQVPSSADTANWNAAYASAHTHSNKAVLDDISSSDVDKWDAAIQGVRLNGVDITPDTGNVIDITISEGEGGDDIDYSTQYLTFEAIEDTTFTFTRNPLQYSLDGGATWTNLSSDSHTPTVSAGNKILWKQGTTTPSIIQNYGMGTFSATGSFKAYGNVMSLCYGDNFIGEVSLSGKNYILQRLFRQNTYLVDSSNLVLPATTLANQCYDSMFSGCTSLTSAPKILPATSLTYYCYQEMFKGCTSLTSAPELPAPTLKMYSYSSMFNGCTSLNYIKCLATNISATNCTSNWVQNVSSTGVFIKADGMTGWTVGNNGIPTGWVDSTESEYGYARGYQIPKKTSDLTNDSGFITSDNISGKTDSTTFGTHSATTIANGTSSQMHLPTVSASDNNKVLMVVNGVWTLVVPSMIYSGSGAPDNSQGNNGDLYIQTS